MAYSLDVVATEYRLIDNYTKKLSSIAGSTDSFGRKLANTLQAVQGFGVGALGALAGGVVALGVASIKSSAENEQLRITLEALTGSADKARQKLAFVRQLAIPSTTGFKELAQAAVTLEAFGLRAEAFLPTLAKLQAAFQNNPEALEVGVRIVGGFASGQAPGIDQLGILGLNKTLFIKAGIKFDEQGKMLSTANEALDALKRIVESKYGNILDKMANTTNAKLATLGDKWEGLKVKIGDALTKYAIPAIDKLTSAIEAIDRSEGFDKFLQRLGKNFVRFVGIVAEALTFLQIALAVLRFAMKDLAGGVLSLVAAGAIMLGAKVFADNAKKILGGLSVGPGSGPLNNVTVPKDPDPKLGNFSPGNEPDKTQDKIEQNTRRTAESMSSFASDLKRYVVGGGPLAEIGVTPAEVGAFQNGQGTAGGQTIQVDAGGRKLNEALSEMIEQGVFKILKSKPGGYHRYVPGR